MINYLLLVNIMSPFLESLSQYKPLIPFYKLVHILDFDNICCKSGKENRINANKPIYNNRKIQNTPISRI